MALTEYRKKRDFRRTPEPRGGKPRRHAELAFVIQKHDASHLHYDFRLELDGVLKSWAVPKGPDLNPATKRLAMQVEDHPLEYGGFEGIIPQGEYGGGTVMLWDQGVWEPLEDAQQGLREGHLKFALHGTKLQGRWMLVRKGGRGSPHERHWFLFKERDEFAKAGKSITDAKPLSVTTGRDLEEIAANSDRVWGPGGEVEQSGRKQKATRRVATAATAKPDAKKERKRRAAPRSSASSRAKLKKLLQHPNAISARLPHSQEVELATLAKETPPGQDWVYEIKYDGYRMLCRIADGKAHFISRNGKDWTKKFPELAEAAGELPIQQAMLDGEVVAINADGTTSYQELQNIFQSGRTSELVYYAFDILHLNGLDVTRLPFDARKELLEAVLASHPATIQYSEHLEGSGADIFSQACRMHLEGVICKRRDQPYRPGRGLDWLKVKCSKREEFVIGGYTPPTGARSHFGALLLGYFDSQHQLIYAGRVGTGFSDKTLAALYPKLTRLSQPKSPFQNLTGATGQARGVKWVKPTLVAEVEFSNWTNEGLLRHPSFQGLREDKPARDVVRDVPLSPQEVEQVTARAKSAASVKRQTPHSRSKSKSKLKAARGKDIEDAPVDNQRVASEQSEVAGVRLTHPDKILYPDVGITKQDLADYYELVADWMLPHVADRVLAIVRCPAGSTKPCFFQKHPGEGASENLRQVNVAGSGKADYNVAVDDLAGLISLVQMGVLEIHTWGSKTKTLEKPDRLIFDLDPDPSVDWPEVVAAAREIRLVLEELGLKSFLKTTGGKGLHLVVPVRPRLNWDETKAFCKAVADFVVRAAPDRYIATMSKAARKGKIFIDYLRNGRGATAIAAYSTRNRPGAPVSVPITWEELGPRVKSDSFTVQNLPARLRKLKKDPWADLLKTKQSITAAMLKRLAELSSQS